MRMLADSKVFAPPDWRAWLGLWLLLGGVSFLSGCTTKNNQADLGATEWEAKTSIQDGKSLDLTDEKSQLSLSRNGTFRWVKGSGSKRRVLEGNYELAAGNSVVMLLKDEVEGGKTHVVELTLTKDAEGNATKLRMKDNQGTIEFEPKK